MTPQPTSYAARPPGLEPASPVDWLTDHGDYLYAFAVRRVRRPDVAEDLLQETLLSAVRGRAYFANRSEVRAWLVGILRHKIADHLRSRYRHENRTVGSLDAQGSPEDDAVFDSRGRWRRAEDSWSGDPQRLAQGREFHRAVDACVAKLPARMAHLFLGRIEDSVPTPVLCEQLGINEANAWTLLHRARLRLRQCLATTWFGHPPPAPSKPRSP